MQANTKTSIILTLLVLLGLALLLLLWRQQAAYQQLQAKLAQLEAQQQVLPMGQAQNAPAAGTDTTAAPTDTPTEGTAPVAATVPPPAKSELPGNRLVLQTMDVQPLDNDRFPRALRTTMQFAPTQSNTVSGVALVIRIPKTSLAAILDLQPVDATPFTEIEKSISKNGKFAIFKGDFRSAAPVSFQLSVSTPVEDVDVRGSCGIGPFKVNLAMAGAAVRHE